MKIDIAGEKSILVELSKDDLTKLNITYDELDYSNAPTKRALFNIMEQIKAETGKSLGSTDKLQIDVMPDSLGGCLMIFTDCASNELTVKNQAVAFVTDNIDNLIDCAKAMKSLKISYPEASLYKNEDCFALAAFNCTGEQKRVLCEFAECQTLTEADYERLTEYYECIRENNALEILCGKSL